MEWFVIGLNGVLLVELGVYAFECEVQKGVIKSDLKCFYYTEQ